MTRFLAILLSAALLSAPGLYAQAVPAAGGSWSAKASTWNIAAGGSYLETSSGGPQLNLYGWSASISEYPYPSFRWLGATAEMSGDYTSSSRTDVSNGTTYHINENQAVYTYAGGPSLTAPAARIAPFGHALFGAINTQIRATANGTSLRRFGSAGHGWPTHAGMLLGGGLDFGVSSSIAIRTQADWVQEWAPSQTVNFVRASIGVVFRF